MVSWEWIIGAFIIGDAVGIVMMAIVFFSREEKAEKKNRQRGNADGSKGGVL